jgi:hypothetical protein
VSVPGKRNRGLELEYIVSGMVLGCGERAREMRKEQVNIKPGFRIEGP